MEKPTINAKQAVNDIRSGMNADELMEKYVLTEAGLNSLLSKLVKAELISQAEMDALISKPKPSGVPAWKCPACGTAQTEKPYVCPQCGVIVAKYEKKEAEFIQPPPVSEEAPGQQARSEAPTRKCPFCSQLISVDDTRCNHCGEWIKSPYDLRVQDEPDREKYCPWEDSETLGAFDAFKQTVSGVLFRPKDFFSRVPPSGGYGKPLLFGMVASSAGIMVGQLWSMLLYQSGDSGALTAILMIILSPMIAVIGLAVGAAISHLCLAVVGGANESFEATFRANCYAAASQLWNVVPLVGGLIAAIWGLVAVIIGLREMHGTDTGKAVLAIMLPAIVCCGLIIVAVWFLGLAWLVGKGG